MLSSVLRCFSACHELIAVAGEQAHAVGGEELVVADGGRDRARVRPRMRQARLHVIGAVAAGLERIDPHDLFAGQARCLRLAGIGALEFEIVGRPLRREAIVIGGGFQEIGDDRDRRARRLGGIGLVLILRARRAAIDRRLRQHIVVDADRLAVAALGETGAALVRDRIPIGARLRLIGVARAGIGREPRLIARARRRLGRDPLGMGRLGRDQRRGGEQNARKYESRTALHVVSPRPPVPPGRPPKNGRGSSTTR